jgi:hypothetical protein
VASLAATQAGVAGFVGKDQELDRIATALDAIAARRPPAASPAVAASPAADRGGADTTGSRSPEADRRWSRDEGDGRRDERHD